MTRAEATLVYPGCVLLLALSRLTDRERHMVVGHCVRGLTFSELGVEAGVSPQRAFFHYTQALPKLARLLARDRARLLEAVA